MIELHDLALDALDGRLLLESLELAVPRGGNQLITGPSGSGKSRLLKVIAGIERPARGLVRVGGRQVWPGDGVLSLIGQVRLGFAFASGGLLSNLTLRENVALPLRFEGIPPGELRQRTEAALERLDLLAVADLRPHAVSASARRHGNLARVLAMDPGLILLDDPLEGLDATDRGIAQDLIRTWAADGVCTLVIAAEEAGSFAYLEAGRLQLHRAPVSVESP
ncbi:MAG: ATP-binding cassette domain-containing protein [Geothrix sp.]|uniref:ATP-binding cassette domain-containing protein n=1 Tax=Geothrix sp. TaxID=1962974 RepID=UPI001829D205|nr:ATP-binding cassette domain-containing protein [Geothrix sp.]NWJ42377.1 ATP-binding cassette domain-containing protein [Geothrix sp.]WIL19656.1 MAG: ATP-binding cassette domain-containing protein [Geothrix sp.]